MKRMVVASFISQDHESQLAQASDGRKAAKELGLPIEIVFAQENAILQVQQVFAHIKAPESERPAAFVIEPVRDEGLERLCRNSLAAGIGWLCLNRTAPYLKTLRRQYPALPICGIVTDQVEAGRIQGRQMRALLPQGGTVLYLHGPVLSAGDGRQRGTEEAIVGGGITLHSLSATWTEESGEKATRAWFRLKQGALDTIDLVACQNDRMAVGARRALLAARPAWAEIPILGMDGFENGGQKLVDGQKLTATVVMPSNAGYAIEIAAKWLETGLQPPVQVLQLPRSYPPEAELRPRAASRRGDGPRGG